MSNCTLNLMSPKDPFLAQNNYTLSQPFSSFIPLPAAFSHSPPNNPQIEPNEYIIAIQKKLPTLHTHLLSAKHGKLEFQRTQPRPVFFFSSHLSFSYANRTNEAMCLHLRCPSSFSWNETILHSISFELVDSISLEPYPLRNFLIFVPPTSKYSQIFGIFVFLYKPYSFNVEKKRMISGDQRVPMKLWEFLVP